MVGDQVKGCEAEVGDGAVELSKAVGPILRAAYNDHRANVSWLSLATEVGFDA